MNRYAFIAAASLFLLSRGPADAQPAASATATAYARTIRFPVYDPRLGTLAAYRRALIAAVDRHVARLEARGPITQIAGAEVIVRTSPARQTQFFEVRGGLAPTMNSNGAMSGSVGTAMVDLPSSRRGAR